MYKNDSNRCIALAALCQAADLVRGLARDGEYSAAHAEPLLQSLMKTDAEDPLEIYGGRHSLKHGYDVLIDQLGNAHHKDIDVTRYVIGLLSLEPKLAKNKQLMAELSRRINDAKRQVEHFSIQDSSVVANLASTYIDIVSSLGPRLQVAGKRDYLQIPSNQEKIRALLLSGIRAAVLWRQLGGKKRHLIFRRNKLVTEAKHQLTQII